MKRFKKHLEEARVTPGDLKAQAEGKKAARKGQKYEENPYEKGSSRHLQWSKGHNAARAGMLKKEEVEQVDELSKDTLRSYKYKAQMSEPEDMRQYKNRSKGIERAGKKLKEKAELDEHLDNVLAYLEENNLELHDITEQQLDEIIGKVVGGAFKAGAKAAVGAARLAGKAVNRMTTSGRAAAAEKKADKAEKKNADRERIKKANDRLKAARDAAAEARRNASENNK